jgi:hypothetical protein
MTPLFSAQNTSAFDSVIGSFSRRIGTLRHPVSLFLRISSNDLDSNKGLLPAFVHSNFDW